MPKAVSLTDSLVKFYKDRITEIALIPSSGGVFEVTVGDQLVFSKKQTERFPEAGEVEKQLEQIVPKE
ncbi:Rdx family protein [Fodinisporobacter ferrooxydans]|uniref:Rdx family protein n=1 Tax=Fodinisporobacter ferrooxydans TaxID=2901836 RepID=A0ABY4CJS7_9BACL|nr:Rdx family protein [Alicyclobacillaceae bacterium MYW30-H2]